MAVLAAAAGALICVMAAVAVDVGGLALHGRRLQGAADLAALAAAADLDRADAAGRATAEANMGPGVRTEVWRGRYVADPARDPEARFTATELEPDAARVTLSDRAPIHFGRLILGRDTVTLRRSATAAAADQRPRAMFSIGSRLAALDGGVANQLLSALTGGAVSLNLMDYEALATTQVNLLTWFDALAVDAGVRAGDYDALLAHRLDAGRALAVLEGLAGDRADSALSKLSSAALGLELRLDRLVGVEAGAARGLAQGLDAEVSALDLVMATLETGGDRQVSLALGASPGLADVQAMLAVGERPNRSPWLTVTDHGDPIIRTAQARLYLKARTAQKLSGLAQVNLPVLVELAAAEARLKRIACGRGPDDPAAEVQVEARPGLVTASIGVIDEDRLGDFKSPLSPAPATLLSLAGLVRVTAQARVEAADPSFTGLTFSRDDIDARRRRSVHSTGLVQGLVASLVRDMRIDVQVPGLGLGLGDLVSAAGVLLTPLAPVLDGLINGVLGVAGLRLGEADLIVHGLSCPAAGSGRPALVG
ncbi:TadG family pilus assembly protein [Brevundimonas sp. VNH65]|uniref:TadG family pilus assembly protein n=1 Tax=Brevundimonas sp. VNH65 TaxID=3400917 RepID=UPI003C03165C